MAVEIQFNVDQALAKLGELVAKHGPQAVDLAADVVRVNALGDVVTGGLLLVLSAVALFAASRLVQRWSTASAAYREWSVDDNRRYAARPDDGSGWGAGAAVAGVVGAMAVLASLTRLADVWVWAAFINPKLALAHQVLAKFAGL